GNARAGAPGGRDARARAGCDRHAARVPARGDLAPGRRGLVVPGGVRPARHQRGQPARPPASGPRQGARGARGVPGREGGVSEAQGMLSCREVVELVTAYLEGALTEAEEVRFEEHLEMCEGCAAYLDQMRRTIDVAGGLDPEAVDVEACDRLIHAFRTWRADSEPEGGSGWRMGSPGREPSGRSPATAGRSPARGRTGPGHRGSSTCRCGSRPSCGASRARARGTASRH